MVPQRERDTEQHVEDADDDGNLHLVSVHEDDLVGFGELWKKLPFEISGDGLLICHV